MKNQGKKALLVGINKYHDSKLSDLKFAVNDVSSIYSVLTDPNRGGFTPDDCLLMTDKSKNKNLKPIRSNVISSIKSLSETAKPGDYIVFFFSGHGIERDGKSYLLPSDARINVLKDTAVSIDWIKTTLKASRANAKVLILDACHAGAMKGKAESGRMTKGLHDALFPPVEGFAILSSCKLNEVSYEMPEKKHGVFSYFLVEGLEGSADFDSDGRIMVSDASRYTTEKTIDWCYKESVQQTPNLEYNVVGDLLLINVPSPEEKKVQRKLKKVEEDFSDLAAPISTIYVSFPYAEQKEIERRTKQYRADFCTYLLRHFALDEIEYVSSGKCIFPLGEFTDFGLRLEYSLQNIGKIDEMIVKSASLIQPMSIAYISSLAIDLKKIAIMLKRTNWTPLKYDPLLYRQKEEEGLPRPVFLEVLANFPELKQQLSLMFRSILRRGKGKSTTEMEESAVIIMVKGEDKPLEGKPLDSRSIQILKPTKFFKLIGDIWKRK